MKIRSILPIILATITGVPRYFPNNEWSYNNFFFNLFRTYEQIFGRRYGIKREASSSVELDEYGKYKVMRSFYTLESFLVHTEATFRSVFFSGETVLVPRLAIASLALTILGIEFHLSGQSLVAPFMIGVIASDNNSEGSDTSSGATLTLAHTSAGSNRIMVMHGNNQLLSSTLSSVTYNGSGATLVFSITQSGAARLSYIHYLVAPTTGTNNIVWTWGASATNLRGGCVVTYSGASQTGQPDASGKTEQASNITINTNITVVASGCWVINGLLGYNQTTGIIVPSGSNTGEICGITDSVFIGDSGGTVATGSINSGWSSAGALQAQVVLSISPAAGSADSGSFLAFF